MAQVIRRHWLLALLNMMLLTGGIGLLGHHFLRSPQRAVADTSGDNSPPATEPAAIDVRTFLRVKQLRDKLALQDRDLAAMGCTQAHASQILSTLLKWVSANSATWSAEAKARATAERSAATLQRQINVGPADLAALANLQTAQQNLASARQQLDELLASAGDSISPLLSNSQQQTWTAAKTNIAMGLPDRFRYASGVTSDQAKAVRLALYRSQNTDLTLSSSAAQDMTSANQNVKQNFKVVIEAEKAVLPIPAQLQPKHKPAMPGRSPSQVAPN